jgi:hypothetical protein
MFGVNTLQLTAKEPSSPCRDLLPFRFAKRAKAIIFSAFARLPIGKWEKVPKGDEGSFSQLAMALQAIARKHQPS